MSWIGQADEEKRQQSNRCKAGNHKQAELGERDSKLNQSRATGFIANSHSRPYEWTHDEVCSIKERVWETSLFWGRLENQPNRSIQEQNGRSWHRGDNSMNWRPRFGSRYVICSVSEISNMKSYVLGSLLEISICIILVKLLSTERTLS